MLCLNRWEIGIPTVTSHNICKETVPTIFTNNIINNNLQMVIKLYKTLSMIFLKY